MLNDIFEATESAQELRALQAKCEIFAADITSPDGVQGLIKATVSAFGKVDILVNNAGITRDTLALRLSEEDWDKVLDTNLKGAFLCTKAALSPMLKNRWGRVVSMSSIVGINGNAGQANYAASKAGLIGMTKSIAKEVASRNITVNAIAPGFIDTDMTRKLPDNVKDEVRKRIPLGSFGKAEDVAAAVCFLASEEAGDITGQVLCVDGGLSMG